MKIAVIGSGISGLTAAYYLSEQNEVTLFEKAERLGGHTATKAVSVDGEQFQVDTGFIVFNDWTYPNFIRLMAELGIAFRNSEMSFSVSCEKTGLEYSGSGLKGLFAQKKNYFSFYFLRMIRDILRFNKEAPRDLETGKINETMTLGEYLDAKKYSDGFQQHYLIPMGAAIWSTSLTEMRDFPVYFFVRFFINHGLLKIKNRPQWKTVKGGSHAYLEPISQSFKQGIHLNCEIEYVKRQENSVVIKRTDRSEESFDHVVFACHSDEALALLQDATRDERKILTAIPYKQNDVVLHTDSSLLPKHSLVRSSWNYLLANNDSGFATLTYDMNTLQGIESKSDLLVTLNQSGQIDKQKILGEYQYSHPQFTVEGLAAQAQWHEINKDRTWFCGAYWRNGFHEDGVYSALRVVNGIDGESKRTRILSGHAREEDVARCQQS